MLLPLRFDGLFVAEADDHANGVTEGAEGGREGLEDGNFLAAFEEGRREGRFLLTLVKCFMVKFPFCLT